MGVRSLRRQGQKVINMAKTLRSLGITAGTQLSAAQSQLQIGTPGRALRLQKIYRGLRLAGSHQCIALQHVNIASEERPGIAAVKLMQSAEHALRIAA